MGRELPPPLPPLSPAPAAPEGARWRVGLTGGIASGKSVVAGHFAALGVPVVDLDLVAREVVAPGTALLGAVIGRFGPGVRRADGSLDRGALRRIVFADAGARRDLEALLHPAIAVRCEQLVAAARGPYVLIVEPLLVEAGHADHYDRVLVVDTDPGLQLERLRRRDGASEAEARAVIAAQADRADRLASAADVIANDGDPATLAMQVRELHERYLGLARASSTIAG